MTETTLRIVSRALLMLPIWLLCGALTLFAGWALYQAAGLVALMWMAV